ncbi:DUF982 domain-containing protein [Pseudaminobacter sp. NGMCC 1.201702]|uniref:DUF982 domain-containing protein n=1 Tax=Pseudaminobacter sp. NGMCC 1.201702 TaxID=3391825 RepID=UPI0039EE7DAE
MDARAFDKPVYLKEGKYLVREITSVTDAIEYLEEWPEPKRDILHEAALRTCSMAYNGLKPVKVARDAIRAFAMKKGILEKEPAVKPWMIQSGSGGRVSA